MSEYRLSEDARQQLNKIADYLGDHQVEAVIPVLDALISSFQFLAEHPQAGQRRDDLVEHLRVRAGQKQARRYVICYYETNGGIEIGAVYHSARDWEALMRSPP